MLLQPNSICDWIVRFLMTATAIELSSNSDTGGFLVGENHRIQSGMLLAAVRLLKKSRYSP
jgi:hypothetical protein